MMGYLHEHVSLAHPPNLGIILIHKNKVVAVISIFSTFQIGMKLPPSPLIEQITLCKETIWKIFRHNRVIDPLSLTGQFPHLLRFWHTWSNRISAFYKLA